MVALLAVVQRLLAEPVAHQSERLARPMIDREGEHADEAVERPDAPFPKRVQHDLGIGLRAEAAAALDQLAAQLAIVVDLTVVDDPPVALGVRHRHAAGRAQIDDAQPIGTEAGLTQAGHALLVGAAMALQGAHLADGVDVILAQALRLQQDQPGDPAHIVTLAFPPIGGREAAAGDPPGAPRQGPRARHCRRSARAGKTQTPARRPRRSPHRSRPSEAPQRRCCGGCAAAGRAGPMRPAWCQERS